MCPVIYLLFVFSSLQVADLLLIWPCDEDDQVAIDLGHAESELGTGTSSCLGVFWRGYLYQLTDQFIIYALRGTLLSG